MSAKKAETKPTKTTAATKTSTKGSTKATTKSTAKPAKKSDGFTAEEKAAMKARAKEMKDAEKASQKRSDGEKALQEAIAEMPKADATMAKKIHKLVSAAAPDLWPKTWYGMPAWAKDGKIICFFQSADKFKVRYATFGFQPDANLDAGNMWPTSFALTKLTEAEEKKISQLVKKASK